MFELDQSKEKTKGAKIKLVGVGGGGGNAVNTMIRAGLSGVDFMVANTDIQALESNLADKKIGIGQEITKGLGAGANPDVGRRAALEDYHKIAEELEGSDMVFITAGMGGGTGTGAAPVIAKVAKELGALTVGVVTKPFNFEGKKRRKQAIDGIRLLKESVDSLITIPNNRLLNLAGNHLSLVDTFKKADEVLLNAVQGISDLINHTGLINSDFADVRTIMSNKGLALMGTGVGEGEHRAVEAATNAISSPLLEDVSIDGATGLIINITGGSDLTTHEVNEATTLIMEAAHEDAEIIFGTVIDEELNSTIKVTVIATGIEQNQDLLANTQAASLTSVDSRQTQRVQESIRVQTPSPQEPAPNNLNRDVTPPPIPDEARDVSNVELSGARTDSMPSNEEESLPRPQLSDSVMHGFGGKTPVAARLEEEQPDLFDDSSFLSESTKSEDESSEEKKEADSVKEQTRSLASDLARAQEIARSLGVTNLSDDEYDIPTFIRKQQSHSEN